MNKLEAQALLFKGYKVAHESFTDEEFVYYDHDAPIRGFYFEDGVKVPLDWWDGVGLGQGWEIYY